MYSNSAGHGGGMSISEGEFSNCGFAQSMRGVYTWDLHAQPVTGNADQFTATSWVST